jgi:hypothetical protein
MSAGYPGAPLLGVRAAVERALGDVIEWAWVNPERFGRLWTHMALEAAAESGFMPSLAPPPRPSELRRLSPSRKLELFGRLLEAGEESPFPALEAALTDAGLIAGLADLLENGDLNRPAFGGGSGHGVCLVRSGPASAPK